MATKYARYDVQPTRFDGVEHVVTDEANAQVWSVYGRKLAPAGDVWLADWIADCRDRDIAKKIALKLNWFKPRVTI